MNAKQTLNLTLEFAYSGSDALIRWFSELNDGINTVFVSPYPADDLPVVIKALDSLQAPHSFSAAEIAILKYHSLWSEQFNNVAPQSAHIIGAALYESLGAQGKALIEQAIGSARNSERALNYLLRFPPQCVGFAALPWELLRSQHHFLLMTPGVEISCERNIVFGQAIPKELAVNEVPHILVLLPHFAMKDSNRLLQINLFERLKKQGVLTYDILSPVTPNGLDAYMRSAVRRPHIVHYTGHGVYRDQEGWLLLDGDQQGKQRRISAEQFSLLIGTVHLAVIQACQSAMIVEGDLLTGVAPALSYAAGAVVAMQLQIRSEISHQFVDIFYDELLSKGTSIQSSLTKARRSLFGVEADRMSWFVPTLYLRVPPQFGRSPRNDGDIAPGRHLVIKSLPEVIVHLARAGVLELEFNQDTQTRKWSLVAFNTSSYDVESINMTARQMPRGVQLTPHQIRIPRVHAGQYSLPIEVYLVFGSITSGTTFSVDIRYLVRQTNVWERHIATFTLQCADEG
ncbi:CHAT domain-containing protein [Candidatus Oscillochloris fontis]|uniref:CHAT domain-containing protein n=1 Tax=Candidatus Oscillochloris fontis TaxID=2496868 RepID=UPI00101E0AFF|nr:CHAT domain-containing protein [Candidatus Oscillochloris fontis]